MPERVRNLLCMVAELTNKLLHAFATFPSCTTRSDSHPEGTPIGGHVKNLGSPRATGHHVRSRQVPSVKSETRARVWSGTTKLTRGH